MIKKTKEHLEMVNETYWQHLSFAVPFALRMIAGGIGGFIHAICPSLFQTTASSTIRTLHKEMDDRLASYKHEHK